MFKLITTMAAVAGALAAFTGAATAGEGVKVSYGDLDLSRPADAATFDQRAMRAARSYCRSEPRPVDTFIRDINGCAAEMLVSVTQALPQAQRQALAAARTRGASTVLAAR